MKKKTMIVLSAAGVCIIAALAIVLVTLLRGSGPLAPQPKTFQEGTTVNGVDVSGLDAEGPPGHWPSGPTNTPSP